MPSLRQNKLAIKSFFAVFYGVIRIQKRPVSKGRRKMSIRIAGTGRYVPEKVLTNADLERMVDTNDEWIRTRTGIEERHIAAENETTSDMAYQAGLQAIEAAGITGADIDLIIVATTTPDYAFPNTATLLQNRFGAKNAFCFDIYTACTGLISSLEIAFALLESRKAYHHALVFGAEKLSCITNWTDRNTCVLFGDGASCVLLEKDDNCSESALLASSLHADGQYANILKLPAGGSAMPACQKSVDENLHTIHMEGKETFKLAVGSMVSACEEAIAQAGISPDDIALVIPHQANIRIIQAVAKRLTVPNEKVYCNIAKYGNTSAASIGICFDEAVRAGQIKRGDIVLMTSFGGGLTWGAILIRY